MSGPFYFAWIDATETVFNPAVHNREDEFVHSFSRDHTEGGIPTLSVDIKNPKVGLLNPGRKVWAWFSWFDGVVIHPLFFGRLVGIPTNVLAEVCTLQLIAKPIDYIDQKQVLAETLKVRPHYDPIFIDIAHRDDPDTILEGYSALWHVDPLTHTLTISDILVGEDGEFDFLEIDAFYDSVSITVGQQPLKQVKLDATVNWTQQARGWVDMGSLNFSTYTGDTFLSEWPISMPGVNLTGMGGGWSAYHCTVRDVYQTAVAFTVSSSYSWQNKEKVHMNGDTMSQSMSETVPILNGSYLTALITESGQSGFVDPYGDPPLNIPMSVNETLMHVPLWQISTTMILQYDAQRSRTEHLVFYLRADLQPIFSNPESPSTSDHELITISGADVGLPIQSYHELTDTLFSPPSTVPGYVPGVYPYTGSAGPLAYGQGIYYIPIGNVARRSYFPTDRGLWSIEYLISIARAHLLLRSRAVTVQFDCRFERAFPLTCRMNARLYDHRLPGGSALGKIIAVSLKGDGDKGTIIGNVTIGCAIGFGNSIAPFDGEPDYVDDGSYVTLGYQHYSGSVVVLPAGDIGYSIPKDSPFDDGLILTSPLRKSDVVLKEVLHGSSAAQAKLITAAFKVSQALANAGPVLSYQDAARRANLAYQSVPDCLKNYGGNPTALGSVWYELQLKPIVNGPFTSEYLITTSLLAVPKQIDLEAHST